jgi:phosphohistidine phosphatase
VKKLGASKKPRMKEIILVRHAKSDWGNESLQDIDRPLNERGYGDAYSMSQWYRGNKKMPDLIASSTATRALSTAMIFMRTLEFSTDKLLLEEDIYESTADNLVKILKKQDNRFSRIMFFGHNPGFTETCNLLGQNFFIDNIPTCGIVSFGFDIAAWKEVSAAGGKPLYHQFPKEFK